MEKIFVIEKYSPIPVIARPDVLVVGSGPAGIGAAISSARNGAKTMIIERYGFVGGALTQAMVMPMFTFHDIHGKQIIKGIAQEFVDRLKKIGASFGHVSDLTFDNASMTTFDAESAKLVLLEMLEEAGVEILLHTNFSTTICEDSKVTTVIVDGKSGRQAIQSKYIIDCTADADIAANSGANFTKGRSEDNAMQPVSLYFRIGNANDTKLRAWMKNNRELLKDSPSDNEIDSQKSIALLGLNSLMLEAVKEGKLDSQIAPRILMYGLPRIGEFAVNTTRLQNIDGTNTTDLTRAEIALRKQIPQVFKFIKDNIGGFENSFVIDSGIQVGVRETRHIEGDYTLTEEDILNSKSFPDGICCGTFAIDIHPPDGKAQIFTGSGKSVYEIPYRALLPKNFDNLLVAGRSISATHTAFGSVRVMATCMACGQGAGTATAMLSKENLKAREIDILKLRANLIRDNQYLLNSKLEDEINERLILKREKSDGQKAAHYNPFEMKT